MLELSGLLLFALNLILTFLLGRTSFAKDIPDRRAAM
jgi:hypothetical protein